MEQKQSTTAQNAQNTAFTAIYIIPSPDGKNYSLEVKVNGEKNGQRIDQIVAQKIVSIDNQMRDPNVQNVLNQSRQNPLGVLQSLMQGMMPQGFPGMGGGMMPGGGFPPMGGMMR